MKITPGSLDENRWQTLLETTEYIHNVAQDVVVIIDGIRATNINIAGNYFNSLCEFLDVDCATVPYFRGKDLMPLLEYKDKGKGKGIIVQCSATALHELEEVRKLIGDLPMFVKDIETRDVDVEAVVKASRNRQHLGIIVNICDSILFAPSDAGFREAAHDEAENWADLINLHR
jgi:hypothetical protein